MPFTNSRVMPDGSLRPYAPEIDMMPDDRVFFPPHPQGAVTVLPPEPPEFDLRLTRLALRCPAVFASA